MEIKTKLLNARISAFKIRSLINLIRNEYLLNAINILKFINKKGSYILLKLLKNIVNNVKNKNLKNLIKLKIYKISAEKGKIIKKIFYRAKGRSDFIHKRFSNIFIYLK
ncbi:putative 50S ribosomal subunit protein L22 [Candidatus Zinderia insecticola CARI]|uniref:50S ribosomal protein L22 n=1 Tax=Zinderia insecticola (strain CARI) TaxID=871271 RepID=E0TJ42_ZINIC|nr:putative 50S ribosomal subunit protein L22 [Candidatus Zinderia insecticola CARI]